MALTISPEDLYFGGPASLTYGGVEVGATTDKPKISFAVTKYEPDFIGAKGPVKGTAIVTKVIPTAEFSVNEMSAAKLAWAMPGCAAVSTQCVGAPSTGLDTTLSADPALGAVTFDLASVTTLLLGDFVRIGAAGVAATTLNSEVLKVTTVGTAAGSNTVLQNDVGGGALLDHANSEEVKTVSGTTLALDADAGDINIKVVKVTGSALFAPADIVRIGYAGQYETRTIVTVGTIGAGGTGITLDQPLNHAHGFGAWVIKVTTLGTTTITWTPDRIADGAYKDLVLTGLGLDNRTLTVTLYDCVSAENQDLEFGDDAITGLKVKMTAYYDPATPRVAPFKIELA